MIIFISKQYVSLLVKLEDLIWKKNNLEVKGRVIKKTINCLRLSRRDNRNRSEINDTLHREIEFGLCIKRNIPKYIFFKQVYSGSQSAA